MSLCKMLQDTVIEAQEFVNGKRYVYVIINTDIDSLIAIYSTYNDANNAIISLEKEHHPHMYNCYQIVKWEVQ